MIPVIEVTLTHRPARDWDWQPGDEPLYDEEPMELTFLELLSVMEIYDKPSTFSPPGARDCVGTGRFETPRGDVISRKLYLADEALPRHLKYWRAAWRASGLTKEKS